MSGNPAGLPAPGESNRGGELPRQDRWRAARRLAGLLLPLIISGLLLWLLMRGLSWQHLVRSIVRSSRPALVLYALATLAGLWLRACRFRLLLAPPRPGTVPILLVTLVQNCLGDLVPGRLASLGSYVYLLVRRLAVGMESAAATFLVSFVFDFVTLGPLLVLAALLRLDAIAPALQAKIPLAWIVALGTVFFIVTVVVVRELGTLTRAMARVAGRAAARFGMARRERISKVLSQLDLLADAVSRVRGGGAMARVFLVSLAIRLTKYAALYALMAGLLTGSDQPGPQPDFWDLIIAISATELIASLPLPALGQFGLWEGGMAGVLVLLGFDREPATIVAIGIHGITQAFEYALGILALAVLVYVTRKIDGRAKTPKL